MCPPSRARFRSASSDTNELNIIDIAAIIIIVLLFICGLIGLLFYCKKKQKDKAKFERNKNEMQNMQQDLATIKATTQRIENETK